MSRVGFWYTGGMKLTGSDCECSPCGKVFGSLKLFDAHQNRQYNPWQLSCTEPEALGLVQTSKGTWVTPERLQDCVRLSEGMAEVRAAR